MVLWCPGIGLAAWSMTTIWTISFSVIFAPLSYPSSCPSPFRWRACSNSHRLKKLFGNLPDLVLVHVLVWDFLLTFLLGPWLYGVLYCLVVRIENRFACCEGLGRPKPGVKCIVVASSSFLTNLVWNEKQAPKRWVDFLTAHITAISKMGN